jgi:hypothetical protein
MDFLKWNFETKSHWHAHQNFLGQRGRLGGGRP